MSTIETHVPLALRGPDGLAVIGRTLHDLRGIRFGDGEGGNAPASEDPAPGEEPQPSGDPAPTDPPADPAADPKPEDKPETFSREYVEQLRKEAAGYRTRAEKDAKDAAEAAEKALVEKLGKALGLIKEDEQPDAAALIAQAQSEKQAAEQASAAAARELAVLKVSDKHGANTTAMLDSRAFVSKLEALDPSADDFAAAVDSLVKDTVASDSKFKRVQVAASSGSSDHGGEGSAAQLTREQFAALSPEERLKAAKEGRITGLLGK